jgi:hypothetical protein
VEIKIRVLVDKSAANPKFLAKAFNSICITARKPDAQSRVIRQRYWQIAKTGKFPEVVHDGREVSQGTGKVNGQ